MEVLPPHCAGLDVHKETVVGCVRHMADGKVTTGVKTFQTATQQLMALSDWLSAEGVTHIAMEATGVYWKPVWHILSDGEFTLVCWPTPPMSRTCRGARPMSTMPPGWLT
jgi:transposase